jgi:hypothetical protein
LKSLQEAYQKQVESVNNRVAKAFSSVSSDYEKMFRSYLDRTTSFQERMGIFTPYRSQTLYIEVTELKDTIKKLEEKISKIEKKTK